MGWSDGSTPAAGGRQEHREKPVRKTWKKDLKLNQRLKFFPQSLECCNYGVKIGNTRDLKLKQHYSRCKHADEFFNVLYSRRWPVSRSPPSYARSPG